MINFVTRLVGYVPPHEIYAILKTIAHNFITERCSGGQMAVGINAVRAICNHMPSVLSIEEDSPEDTMMEEDATSGKDKKSSCAQFSCLCQTSRSFCRNRW